MSDKLLFGSLSDFERFHDVGLVGDIASFPCSLDPEGRCFLRHACSTPLFQKAGEQYRAYRSSALQHYRNWEEALPVLHPPTLEDIRR